MKDLTFLKYLRGIYNLNLNSSSKVHQAIIQAIYNCFVMAEKDLHLSRLEMCLSSATGDWLNNWGSYFSVYRKSGEEDDVYRERIIYSVVQPKSTIPAIKSAVISYLNAKYDESYTENDVIINEPWEQIAKYSHKGLLSKDARFYSPNYYCHAILEINIPQEITKDLMDLVASIKAAGIKVLWTTVNSYDVVTDFSKVDNIWADYWRWAKTYTKRNKFSGLVLSDSYVKPTLSGHQEIWRQLECSYQWYAIIKNRETDDSIILSKKDLFGLLDSFSKTTNKEQQIFEDTLVTEELITSLSELDKFMKTSEQGRLSCKDGILWEYTSSELLWNDLLKALNEFKNSNLEYYNSVQPPILNGNRVMWLVPRHKNWIWNTPLMNPDDFKQYWEPLPGYPEHTVDSIIKFEETNYDKYITFGDIYQAPIEIGNPKYWTPQISFLWMYDSPAFCNSDLEAIYAQQFYSAQSIHKDEPTLEDIISLEENYKLVTYSHICDVQPEIEIKTETEIIT